MAPSSQVAPRLQVLGLSKSFPGVKAVKSVSFDLHAGEVLGLLGENGAGKSTLIKILSGVHGRDSGEVLLNGQAVSFASPAQALAGGIATVYQEGTLAPNLSAPDNITLGSERGPRLMSFWLRERELVERTRKLAGEIGFDIPLNKPVRELSVAHQQLVEILRALSHNASVLILDEPTASLASQEVELLFAAMRRLRADGLSFIYITHRLEEVPEICDCAIVMRDGLVAGKLVEDEASEAAIIRLMIGREIGVLYPEKHCVTGETILEATGITSKRLRPVSLTLNHGEIVGLTGLLGAGQREFARCLFGLDVRSSGQVRLAGRIVPPGKPAASVAVGLTYLSPDRKGEGVIPALGVLENTTLACLERFSRFGLVARRREKSFGRTLRDRFGIRCYGLSQPMGTLSGGNQQKALLARSAATQPEVLILDEPTHGVDIGAKEEIYRLIRQMAAEGMGVLIVSSDLLEIMGMCDRMVVFARGAQVGDISAAQASEEVLLTMACGQAVPEETEE